MPPFDPIASPTVRLAPHREPAFVFPDQAEAARQKLAAYAARTGRRPNILVILFDDVGWGDFGCYGGGVAVGAPTPGDRRPRPARPPAHVVLLGAVVLAVAGHAAHRPPAEAPRLQRPPMYGEPGGLQGEVTLPQLLADAGYATQAVGKWHLGENVESQPQNVGFDDFYGFLSVSDMYTEWRDPYFFPEIVYSEARTEWLRNMPFKVFAPTWHPVPAPRRHVVRLLDPLHPPHGRLVRRGSSITARAAPTSTTTRSSASSDPHRPATPTRTRSSSWTTSSDASCASSKPAASSSTR